MSFPHRRGGGPLAAIVSLLDEMFSPQAWGWTVEHAVGYDISVVFPTGVGVDRKPPTGGFCFDSFPHRRGGGPIAALRIEAMAEVFPTGVGVDRRRANPRAGQRRFPHRRGGGPNTNSNSRWN